MSVATLSSASVPVPGWHSLRTAHGPWARQVQIYALLLGAALLLMLVDERMLLGVSVWLKPAKFALSILVYFATLAWIAALVPGGYFTTRAGRAMTALAIAPAAFEIFYIFLMAGLGQPSHFNNSSPVTAVAYQLMGLGAVLLVSVCLWLAVVVMRRCDNWARDPLLFAVVLGLALTFLLGGGFGGYLGAQTSHWVGGAATDANGLPLVGWSSSGGDLRVAHFFGMHAMQVLPAVGWLLRRLSFGVPLVMIAALAYGALSSWTFVQGVQGQPLL